MTQAAVTRSNTQPEQGRGTTAALVEGRVRLAERIVAAELGSAGLRSPVDSTATEVLLFHVSLMMWRGVRNWPLTPALAIWEAGVLVQIPVGVAVVHLNAVEHINPESVDRCSSVAAPSTSRRPSQAPRTPKVYVRAATRGRWPAGSTGWAGAVVRPP